MKVRRQNRLLEIVQNHEVETQEQLLDLLHQSGYKVTQATVSRDIKELRLAKISSGKGGYKYSLPPSGITKGDLYRRARRIFGDYVREVDFSGPLVLVRTYPGGAQAVAAVIDEFEWPEMIGCVAGDDSILILTRSKREKSVPTGPTGKVFGRLKELHKG